MTSRAWLGKILAALPLVAGAALIASAFSMGAVSAEAPATLWSLLASMLPVPGGNPVPEIDPGSACNAIALLTGGVLMLVGMRRKEAKPEEA